MEHPPFDYLYEFSETRKVLEEFFTPQQQQQFQQEKLLQFQQQAKRQQAQQLLPLDADFDDPQSSMYIEQRLAALKQQKHQYEHQLQQQYENQNIFKNKERDPELYLGDSGENSRSSCCEGDMDEDNLHASNNLKSSNKITQPYFDLEAQNYYISNIQQSKNITLSPETTDYDSNCGDLDSELSLKYDYSLTSDINGVQDSGRLYTGMPVLEDGLSSGHESDTENNNPNVSVLLDMENNTPLSNQNMPIGISSIQTSYYNEVDLPCNNASAQNNNEILEKKQSSKSNLNFLLEIAHFLLEGTISKKYAT